MPTVVVLGAGQLGAAVASQLTRDDVIRRVVLVDFAAAVAQGLALDIRQATSVHGATSVAEGTSDLGVVIGATVVVVADRHGAGEWRDDDGLALLTSMRALNPRAPIICAGAGQASLVERFVAERDQHPRWIAGSAPEAARAAATALIALEAAAGARDVSVAMIGRPPAALFPAWDGASIAGSRAADVLNAADVLRLERQMSALGPPGPLGLAAAASAVVRRFVRRTADWSCLFVVPEERGRRSRGIAVPASFDQAGIRVQWPVLSPRDRTRLDTLLGV